MARGTPTDIAAGIEAVAAARGLGVDSVVAVRRFASGLSSQSYAVDVVVAGRPQRWVLRREPERGVIPPYDIVSEARLMQAVRDQGLPVPRVVHVEEDPEPLGGRFMLMERVDGAGYRAQDPGLGADAELLAALGDEFVAVLARIHAADQDVLPTYADSADAARAQVTTCRRRLDATAVTAQPILAEALDALDELAPAGAPLVLCHGDYRLPNLKWRERRIVGVLDWELACVGDPMADLAFSQTIGVGHCSIVGPLAERYEALSANAVDEERIAYYRLLEMVKGVVIGMAGAHDLVAGGDDLRLLSTAGLGASGVPVVGMLRKHLRSLAEARR